ncbi:hypothetical protein B0T11DRAFT_292438 [Plectosphaerella cucumerina]|uniref:Uncharacterized protein n=1 Tax=Plectosphaerella cucumerina TaxID=40658 RepID=A0A8K0X965_9PEZI|nr:hypothetical protein B0T11DRAFT_292438 [Plectosphaerella cucumerina]
MAAVPALLSAYADKALFYLANLNTLEKMMYLWGFVLGGILLAVQASQIGEKTQFEWTKLNARTKPYWFTTYLTIFGLLLTGSHDIWTAKMETWPFLFGREQQIMNGLWLGVVGLDIVMVFYATLTFLTRTMVPAPKQKAQ